MYVRLRIMIPDAFDQETDSDRDQHQGPPIAETVKKNDSDVDQSYPDHQSAKADPAMAAIREVTYQKPDNEYPAHSDGKI